MSLTYLSITGKLKVPVMETVVFNKFWLDITFRPIIYPIFLLITEPGPKRGVF